MRIRSTPLFLLVLIGFAAPAIAQSIQLRPDQVDKLPWRHLGPVNMVGRITDFEPVASQPGLWYVATASGGLFKTENAGTTWTPLFQKQTSISMGDVAVAPSDPNIVWVGTGEENGRNSVSWGDGVYKSTDAGKTFTKMGLEKSFQIGHIAIHPSNPDVVYVAALGRLWGPNEERGVYRTTDGGKSWKRILFADARTGCIDVRLDPHDPNRVFAVLYERMRDQFDGNDPATRFGPKAGIYRSDDGGDNWARLQKGLPTCNWGRCSIEPYASKKGVLYALIETERSGWARGDAKTTRSNRAYMGVEMSEEATEGGVLLLDVVRGSPAEKAGLQSGDIVAAVDGEKVADADALSKSIDAHENGDKVKVAILRGGEAKDIELQFGPANTGGNGPNSGRLGGQNGNVQSRQGDLGYETGGVYRSKDHGETWERLNSLIPRPFYFCSFTVDPSDDSKIYVCGIQLWRSTDGGRRFRQCNQGIHVDFHDVWVNPNDSDHVVACSDGGVNVSYDATRTWEVLDNFCCAQPYHVGVDQSLPYNVFGGLQDNGTWGGPSRTRYSNGLTKEDWIKIYSGDGFGAQIDPEDANTVYATSQLGNVGRVDLGSGRQARISKANNVDGKRVVWNWDTPFFLSPHNNKILYVAGSFVFRSIDRGTTTKPISGKLSLTNRGSATALAESPRVAGVLYCGTDDGGLWVSKDDGGAWTRIDENLPDMPGPRYVSSVTPSKHSASRVFLTMDGHRSDDNATYVFQSDDYGATWRSLKSNLPDDTPCHKIVEDPRKNRLLFLGTEFGAFVSLDRGKVWQKLTGNFPTVPVRDLVIQDRDSDLVAATHGRGFWVLDIEPLRQLTRTQSRRGAHLFAPQPAYLWRTISRYQTGHKMWAAPKAPNGSSIYLHFAKAPEKPPKVVIKDLLGKELATLTGKAVPGIQRIIWNARAQARPRVRPGSSSPRRSRGRRRGGRGRFGGRPVPPGTYSVTLEHDGKTQTQSIELRPDPELNNRDQHPLTRK